MTYPDEWNHPPHADGPMETDATQSLNACCRLLEAAASVILDHDQTELFNKIKGLQDEAETVRQQLLVPPAP